MNTRVASSMHVQKLTITPSVSWKEFNFEHERSYRCLYKECIIHCHGCGFPIWWVHEVEETLRQVYDYYKLQVEHVLCFNIFGS